jgi:RNase P subunit RPR2
MSLELVIECLDCGRSRGIRDVPLDGGATYWKRFHCSACRAVGGKGRNFTVSKMERSNADRSLRPNVQARG